MKLFHIWYAKKSWDALSELRKRPQVSFLLMSYYRKYLEQFRIIDEERATYIKEFGTETEGGFSIEPGTAEFQKFQFKFGEYLSAESDLEPLSMSMQELVDAISDESDGEAQNAISERELLPLMAFFSDTAEELAADEERGQQRAAEGAH